MTINQQLGSSVTVILKRTLNVSLAFLGFVSLVVGISLAKSYEKPSVAVAVHSAAPVAVASVDAKTLEAKSKSNFKLGNKQNPKLEVKPDKPDLKGENKSDNKPIMNAWTKTKLLPQTETKAFLTSKPVLMIAKGEDVPLKEENKAAPATPVAAAPKQDKESLDASEDDKVSIRTVKVREGDTLTKIFTRLGASTKDVKAMIASDPAARRLATLQAGQTLKLKITSSRQIAGLTLDIAPGDILNVAKKSDGFDVEHKVTPVEKQLAFSKGAIKKSLSTSAKRAGLDSNIANQLVDIFGRSIDFELDLRPKDTFRVLYEEKYIDGEKIQTGHILAAEIINDGKKHQAVRYTDKSGRTGYFSPDGYGLHQTFLRTPVNFARVSSNFGNRKHPILHRLREHKGVDYSAPRGTPVQAVADGKVAFVGVRGGYGKVVELQHGARYSTLYAHLHKFPKDLCIGKQVKQSDIIGFVGRTGLATGDHLHYEFRIDGIHRDPLTVALPKKSPLPDSSKPHFLAHAKQMIRLLDIDKLSVLPRLLRLRRHDQRVRQFFELE